MLTFKVPIFMALWLACVLFAGGCSAMYPKLLDDPRVIEAAAKALEQSSKTWEAESSVTNPTVEFYYIVGVGARMTGVEARLGARGAAGPTEPGP